MNKKQVVVKNGLPYQAFASDSHIEVCNRLQEYIKNKDYSILNKVVSELFEEIKKEKSNCLNL